MRVRQRLWRLAAYAPLSAWGFAAAMPIAYGGWTLRHASIVDLDLVQQQTSTATATVLDLRRQLEALQERQSGEDRSELASEHLLELLLRYRCGLSRGFELNRTDGRAALVFNGSSMESLCALRVVWQFPGGVQRLRRDAAGAADFAWEGTQQ